METDFQRAGRKLRARLIWVTGILILLALSYFSLIAFRFIALPVLIATWVVFVRLGKRDLRPPLILCMIWLALTFSPVDIAPIPNRGGGPPRLVPLVMGLPTPETLERAKRGEVKLGGCIVSGFEPQYYLVW